MLVITLSVLPIHGYTADSLATVGRAAQTLGKEQANALQQSAGKVEQGQITLPSLKNGQFSSEGQPSFSVTELFPGTSASQQATSQDYFPDQQQPQVAELQSIYDANNEMNAAGSAAQKNRYADANSSHPSLSGAAYKILLDATNRSRPQFTQDPMLTLSKDTYQQIDLIAQGFGDCRADTQVIASSTTTHVPTYELCTRVVDRSAECDIVHDYDAAVVTHHSGPYNIKSCGADCTELWIGKVGDNYWDGWCSVYEESTSVVVTNPEAIVSATLEYAKYDDYMQVWVGTAGAETKVWQGPNGQFPPDTQGNCELSTSWSQQLNVDVTRYFRNVAPGAVVTFKIRVSVAGEGEGFGRIKLRYDPAKTVTKDSWTPQSCFDSAQGVTDKFATGSIECTDMPTLDANQCTMLNGILVCERHLSSSPLPGISNLCKKVHVKADWDYYKGTMACWIDPQGISHCPVNQGGNLNSCKQLESNSQCGFISQAVWTVPKAVQVTVMYLKIPMIAGRMSLCRP